MPMDLAGMPPIWLRLVFSPGGLPCNIQVTGRRWAALGTFAAVKLIAMLYLVRAFRWGFRAALRLSERRVKVARNKDARTERVIGRGLSL
jgi:hypothetical protein